jgi:hypothetical protein
MSKFNNTTTLESDDDDELEYKEMNIKSAKPITQSVLAPAPPVKPPKQKRNLTEEHKQQLRERIAILNEKKRANAEIKRKQKEEEDRIFLELKQKKILEEAKKLEKRRQKELKQIEIPEPVIKKVVKEKPKQKYVLYLNDDSDDESENEESEEEEEEIIVKKPVKKNKPQQPTQPQPQPVKQVVSQPPVIQKPPAPIIRWC